MIKPTQQISHFFLLLEYYEPGYVHSTSRYVFSQNMRYIAS